MNFITNLKQTYFQGNAVIRLLFVNAFVYMVLQMLMVILKLFNVDGSVLYVFLSLPSEPMTLLLRPWTLITYMFLHQGFLHMLFNMLALYWFGRLFLTYFNEKQLYGLYLLGGISSGILYILAYNIFPLFATTHAMLMGASGSIMAIILAVAAYAPNVEMRFLLLGAIKLKYIAAAVVLISFFGITSFNAGGEIAHLGGALYGYVFVVSLRRGKDSTKLLNRILDALYTLFQPKKLKVSATSKNRKMSDADYNVYKKKQMDDIDRILDKIKASGYGSLTAEEKKQLFDQSKKSNP